MKPGCPLTFHSLVPFALFIMLLNTLSANPRTGSMELLFPWAKSTSCDWSQHLTQGKLHWGPRTPLLGRKRNKECGWVPPAHHTPVHYVYTDGNIWLQGTVLGFHGFWSPLLIAFPCRFDVWQSNHRRNTYLPRKYRPFSVMPWRSEKPEGYKRAKKLLWFRAIYQKIKKLLINILEKCHSYVDA